MEDIYKIARAMVATCGNTRKSFLLSFSTPNAGRFIFMLWYILKKTSS